MDYLLIPFAELEIGNEFRSLSGVTFVKTAEFGAVVTSNGQPQHGWGTTLFYPSDVVIYKIEWEPVEVDIRNS